MNQLISAAVGEKLACLLTADHLRERGRSGSRAAYDRVLRGEPDIPPAPEDALPLRRTRRRAASR